MKKNILALAFMLCTIAQGYANPICSGKEYDPAKQFCADNNIYPKCNGGSYVPSTQFCAADNKVYPKCSGNSYDPAKLFCMDNNIHAKCDGSIYVSSTQFCAADNKVYPKCGSNSYDPAKQFCTDNNTYAKCGGSTYAPSTQFCAADNKVYSKCGGNNYDPAKQLCTDNNIYPKCGSAYAPSTQFCAADNKVYSKCSGNNYDPAKQFCTDNNIYPKCNGSTYATSTQFCAADNKVYPKCSGNSYEPAKQFCASDYLYDNCGGKPYTISAEYCHNGTITKKVLGSLTDNREPHNVLTYKTLTIGTKTWMAENLKYRTGAELCYNACDKYGALYNWEKAENICPAGWRIPTNNDWNELVNYAGGSGNAGKKLKAKSGWSGNGTDDYDFSALPAGFISRGDKNSMAFSYDFGNVGYWWGVAGQQPYQWSIGNGNSVGNTSWNIRNDGYFSVRCVKD